MFNSPLYYYSNLFMVACSYLAMIVSYKNRKKFFGLENFHTYAFASFVQTALVFFAERVPIVDPLAYQIHWASTFIFVGVEAWICLLFFYKVINYKFVKQLILYLSIVYLIGASLSLIFLTQAAALFIIFLIQAIVILIPGFIHLVELFQDITIQDLFNKPTFWIVLGLIIYFTCTFPFYLVCYFLADEVYINMASINAICYGIFFLLIMRAYLCTSINLTKKVMHGFSY